MNQITLCGNLTRDPDMRYTPNGTAIVSTGIAVSRKWKGSDGQKKEKTTFVTLNVWGKAGETFHKYTCKGAKVLVVGRLEIDQVDKDGKKNYYTKVVVENFEFVGGKRKDEGSNPALPGTPPAAFSSAPARSPALPAGVVEDPEDDWGVLPGDVPAEAVDTGLTLPNDEGEVEAPLGLPEGDMDIPW